MAAEPAADTPQRPPSVAYEVDPEGDLRLEGQVLDLEDRPVGGATVSISSNPPRQATTEDDGSFFFDKLTGRSYSISARYQDLVGGPMAHRLSTASEPVILRLRQGATLEVTVLSASSGEPLAGATVDLRGADDRSETTDEMGRASFRGAAPGFQVASAIAPGHARGQSLVEVPEGQTLVRVQVALQGGATVRGTVVDSAGKPVANAKVIARDISELIDLTSAKKDGVATDAEGRFEIPAVASGTYRFVATHDHHPPSSSEAMTIDGKTETAGVEIVMQDGATLAGRVITATGDPAPWAAVRVMQQLSSGGGLPSSVRGATADRDGRFELSGLPRTTIQALAMVDDASSEIAVADLTGKERVDDLVLTLSVTGAIAGRVVDGADHPVAEATVTALPDFWAGGEIRDFALRGVKSATSDGDGAFRISGLPNGTFRLRAARSAGSGFDLYRKPGVQAATGDTGVVLVVLAPGRVVGRVQMDDGSAATAFTVIATLPPGVPVGDDKGRFDIPLEPGTYNLLIRGPGFTDKTMPSVEVKEDATNDLGTITVTRGRSARGRVVDATGNGVAGATVILAQQIIGDGKSILLSAGSAAEQSMGVRRTQTDDSGNFTLIGIGDKEAAIAAEHTTSGRSLAQRVPAGREDAEINLLLLGTGSLSGIVTAGGQISRDVQVLATADASPMHNLVVTTDEQGRYGFDRLAEGTYKLTAILGAAGSGNMGGSSVTIRSGQKSEANIEIEIGDIDLAVTVAGQAGAKIDAAQVFMFRGVVEAKSGGELHEVFLTAMESGGAKMGFATGPSPASFSQVLPGRISVCVVPITGDMSDPQFQRRIQENRFQLEVHCRQHTVAESPPKQEYRIEVPAMKPLPEPGEP